MFQHSSFTSSFIHSVFIYGVPTTGGYYRSNNVLVAGVVSVNKKTKIPTVTESVL